MDDIYSTFDYRVTAQYKASTGLWYNAAIADACNDVMTRSVLSIKMSGLECCLKAPSQATEGYDSNCEAVEQPFTAVVLGNYLTVLYDTMLRTVLKSLLLPSEEYFPVWC